MDITGEHTIPVPRDDVWRGLNDPDLLKHCIPGCDSLEKVSDTEFKGTVTAKVGPVKAKFRGSVTLADLDPPNGYTLKGEGQGAAAGFARGDAKVTLAEDGDGTRLSYVVTAHVGGKLAQVGSRLVGGTVNKLAGEFFACFGEALAAQGAEVSAPEGAPEPAPPAADRPQAAPILAPTAAPQPDAVPVGGGLSPKIWVPGLIALVAVLLWLFVGQ